MTNAIVSLCFRMDRSSDVTPRELRIESPALEMCRAFSSIQHAAAESWWRSSSFEGRACLSLTACVARPPPQAQAPTPGVVGVPSRGRCVGREGARALPLHCALAGAVHCSSACGFLASGLGPKFGTSSINREHMLGPRLLFPRGQPLATKSLARPGAAGRTCSKRSTPPCRRPCATCWAAWFRPDLVSFT